MERKADNSNAVSNLLNLTDGFLADFLNLKIICTFNTDLNNIDEALLREGRMKGMHEFTKIQPGRAQKIANVLGSDICPQQSMTLAEICADKNTSHDFKPTKIGFDNFPIDKPFN
jgi:ATP-dependent 26S proteasome regulatory subunit